MGSGTIIMHLSRGFTTDEPSVLAEGNGSLGGVLSPLTTLNDASWKCSVAETLGRMFV